MILFKVGDRVRVKTRQEVPQYLNIRDKPGTVISSAGHQHEKDELMVKLDDGRIIAVKQKNLAKLYAEN